MTVIKQPVVPERLRIVPAGFGWVDHRFVRERHIGGVSCEALALYLFLLTVADGSGLSHWSPRSIGGLLDLTVCRIEQASAELQSRDLVAYAPPLWQVLSLPEGGRRC
jgi:hypothetical protein